MSWRPNPDDPPYIYVWGNQWYPSTVMPTLEYHTPGATDRKYMDDNIAYLLPKPEMFNTIYQTVNFDYSWVPDPHSPPYIYVFGNSQHDAYSMPTIEYHVPGATEKKYITDIAPKLVPRPEDFEFLEDINLRSFDFRWVPDPNSPPYIYAWGNQWHCAEDKISMIYKVEGATEYRYMTERVKRNPSRNNWVIPENLTCDTFDFSWEPKPAEPSYIYQFGTQWQKTGGPKYVVEGATEIKYFSNLKGSSKITNLNATARLLPTNINKWKIPRNVDQATFDFSWHPDDTDPPYIYQFPSNWSKTGGPKFIVDGATEIKYLDYPTAKVKQDMTHWSIPHGLDTSAFDFSWHPDIEDKPYIYQFGTQWQKTDGPVFTAPGCDLDTPIKYIDILKAKRLSDQTNWDIPDNLEEFDFSWHPDSSEPAYIYQFPSTWSKTGGPKFTSEGATDVKYIDFPIAKLKSNKTNWIIPAGFDETKFDFSWHPDATSPPYIYQFGTLLEDIHLQDGPKYITPGHDGHVVLLENILISEDSIIQYPQYYIETTIDDLIEKHKDEIFWALRKNIDYTKFDFNWQPTKEQSFNINTFGSPDSETTQTHLVNGKMWQQGYKDISFIENTKLDEEYLSKLFKKVDAFFVDRGNIESSDRFEQLKLTFPTLQKTRYLNSWVDTINRCTNKSTTELCWILNSELDYSDFDFNYYPNPWQMKMVHVFGTQWSHWGTTFLVNKETFAEDTKYVKIIEHLSMLNFVKNKKAKATNCLYDIILIDHGNGVNEINNMPVLRVPYYHSYLHTFRNIISQLPIKNDHYIWICNSICDYSNFDFTYICDPYAKDQLHVFPSDNQKFGDTFLVDVNKLRGLIDDMIVLEDFNKINFNQHLRTKRLPAPIFINESDTHVSINNYDFDWPYATFISSDNKEIIIKDTEPMSLWSNETKNIIIHSTGGTIITVPKEAKAYIEHELYDYPYIDKSRKLVKSKPLDIVFLSNGETGADENYEHLLKVTKGLPNRIVRVDGVNGRVAAYHAAAEASDTPWMFTVFAKLKVNDKFDWTWQPDRLQIAKHYIFYATNPVNGLLYGHQGLICYNKKLTLNNLGYGLDFTLDDEHEVIEINSGVARYNTDEFSTWRTSFREAIKLRLEDSTISRYRLNIWSTVGEGDFAQYSINGALDAVEYFEQVNGELDKLRLSYDWPWLQEYFNTKYN